MAKDGTVRGGRRVGSGKKPTGPNREMLDLGLAGIPDFPEPGELEAVDMPPIDDFLKETQRDGTQLEAERVFKQTYAWLKKHSCEKLVPKQLINQYAMAVARWIQAEQYISRLGSIAKHPTVGTPITSPYVTMSLNYTKQISNTWFQIYSIVKDNGNAGAELEEEDMTMERLLRSRRR